MRRRAELALLGLAVIWGTSFVVVKDALADISPLLFLAARFAVAAVVLTAIYHRSLRRAALGPGLLAGVLLFTAFVFQTEGLALTTPSKSAFLTGLSIPLVPFVNSLVYRVRPKTYEVIGILTGSVGVAMMTLPAGRFEMSAGDFLSVLCAVAFAFHLVVIGHFSPIVGFEGIAVIQVTAAAVLGLVSAWFTSAERLGPVRFHPTVGLGLAILAMGVLATALAFTTLTWAQQFTTATRSALILTLEPAMAWLTSYVVTGEALSDRGKIGAGLILAGVLLVELKRSKPEILNI